MTDVSYGSMELRQTAEEMDERRQKNMAYEYLCHLEEAKKWLEAVLREELPPTTELEENLRNGVYLAKVGHFVAPDVIPLSKIYDIEHKRFKAVGLQFRHTDNINYWLKSLEVSGLPMTFHPETTDVYDKKNMPRVIFCLHALSTHLYKLGKAPLIQDLYGKVNFTDAEIDAVRLELQKYGIQMPAFQKIGGLLANELGDDAAVHHAAIIAINEKIDQEEMEGIVEVLSTPAARLEHLNPSLIVHYHTMLSEAKATKAEGALNRSANESYVPDVYDELLTHAEIQGHITTVNVLHAWYEVIEAAGRRDDESVSRCLSNKCLELKDIKAENIPFYVEELCPMSESECDLQMVDYRNMLQMAINKANMRVDRQQNAAAAVRCVNVAVENGTEEDLYAALLNPVLELEVNKYALPLYLEEMRADRIHAGKDLSYNEIKGCLHVLTCIATISQAVDLCNAEQTWEALYNPDAHFTDLDPAFKVKYWRALTACRQQKLADKCECSILTYYDVQKCVDMVNQQCEDNNQIILALHSLNIAVQLKNPVAIMKALQNPVLKMSVIISNEDSVLLLKVLENCWLQKYKEGTELWLEDIHKAMDCVLQEAEEVTEACRTLSYISMAIQNNGLCNQESLDVGNLDVIGSIKQLGRKHVIPLKDFQCKKESKLKCPWIIYKTSKGNKVYINVATCKYTWTKPCDFQPCSQYLNKKDIEEAVGIVDGKQKQNTTEKMVICLQSYCRGYLVRKTLAYRRLLRSVILIQAWWRGIKQRHIYRAILGSKSTKDPLEYYKKHERKIVRLQAVWRGRQARRAFLSLFHQAQPSFRVVCQFASFLDINSDDYSRELQLQNLKAQVVKLIRHSKQLAQQLDAMDIKIGLLVRNRISLQDVQAHSKNLNDLAHEMTFVEPGGNKGLKSLTKESHKLLECYQHIFYMLQTIPSYLTKLMFCLPQSESTKFLNTVILALFNFGSNSRESYLLLRLFRSALQEEIRCKVQKPGDMITSVPKVLLLVLEYARQMVGQVSLQNMLGPLVQKVLDNKNLSIDTNPIDIYKSWRNQQEMTTGKISELPYMVSQETALSYGEVQERLREGIRSLKEMTLMFLQHITESRNMIPYGVLYMAKVIHSALTEKFPSAPEKDILKVVGNFIYYHYINSAIVAPESFGIITLSADQTLSSVQRHNLASIAKILQFSSSKKGFGEESSHLMCLNSFIIECHKQFKKFFHDCCEVEELEEHFSIHQYSEATLITRPVIYITLQEICDTHKLLVQYLDKITCDPLDPLCELLDEMGPAPDYATLVGGNSRDVVLPHLAQAQICLTLVNKFEVPEDDMTDINKLFIKAKELLVSILPCLRGSCLLEALMASETPEDNQLFKELVTQRASNEQQHKMLYRTFVTEMNLSLQECKTQLRQYLCKLELEGLLSEADGYQTIITAIAHDICNKGKYRQILAKELQTLRATKQSLDEKAAFYEDQVVLYNQYIEKCLENLNAGKRNVHSLKTEKQHRNMKSKLVLKYTAAKLHEKGILLEVEGLPISQFKNVQFEIAPTDHNGVFTIRGKFMGVEMEKVDVDIQDLLQLQYERVSIMDIFGKAKVNVNLLLFLLNKKFYGKP